VMVVGRLVRLASRGDVDPAAFAAEYRAIASGPG